MMVSDLLFLPFNRRPPICQTSSTFRQQPPGFLACSPAQYEIVCHTEYHSTQHSSIHLPYSFTLLDTHCAFPTGQRYLCRSVLGPQGRYLPTEVGHKFPILTSLAFRSPSIFHTPYQLQPCHTDALATPGGSSPSTSHATLPCLKHKRNSQPTQPLLFLHRCLCLPSNQPYSHQTTSPTIKATSQTTRLDHRLRIVPMKS
jgi:hypothetical protein